MTASRVEHLAEGVSLYLGDCREILPTLGKVDAVVTDPPYGIGEAAGKAKTRTSGFTSKFKNAQDYRRDYGDDDWDSAPIDVELLTLVRAAAPISIIFGGNYYDLSPTSCWLVWDKLNGDTDFADCELAWTNMRKAVRRIQYLWNGAIRANKETRGDHPTQKPIGVMRWAISLIPPPALKIIDPFMGSGTTGVAAVALGREFIGIERVEKYFDAACRRISDARASFVPDMFADKPKDSASSALDKDRGAGTLFAEVRE
jgi:site-specific DNA-methyltransferase (adenine-specific)/modification methylase